MARQMSASKGQGWNAARFRHVVPTPSEIEHGPFSLNEILDEAAQLTGRAGGAALFSVADGVPAELTGDSANLRRILAALTGQIPGSINADELTTDVDVAGSLFDSGRRSVILRFAVRGDGGGLTCAQAVDLLAEVCSFAVAGPESDGAEEMVSIRELVDGMGGSIAVASEPGCGFVLSFTAVLGVAAAADGHDPAPYGAGAGPQTRMRMPDGLDRLQGARILLAEDHPVNQNLTREILRHAGCSVDVVADGQKTVDAIRDHSKSYDAVIMDVQMPIMDGFEATRIIREELAKSDLPIVAMTANVIGDERERCLAAGMDDYVPKPIHIPDLYASLIRCVARSRPDADGAGTPDAASDGAAEPAGDADIRLPSRLPGIDVETGLGRAMGNRSLYAELLTEFMNNNRTVGTELAATVAAGDLERARFLVHGLVSTAGNLGAEPLYDTAKALEKALYEPTDDIGDLVGAFRDRLAMVVDGLLESGISAQVGAVTLGDGVEPLDREAAVRTVERLTAMLHNQDMAARTFLNKLLEMFGGRGQDEELKRLKASLEALDFPQAREILEKICKDIVG